MCVNARKTQQPDTVVTLPKTHQDCYIPERLQWKVNEFQLERQRLKKLENERLRLDKKLEGERLRLDKKLEDERLRLEKIQRKKDLRNEKHHLDQLKRKANKEEQESKRIKAYQEFDVESLNLNALKQYSPIQQQYVENTNKIGESPVVTYFKKQLKIKAVQELAQTEEPYPKKEVKKAQQMTQRKELQSRQLAEKQKQEQDRIQAYHNLDVTSPYFNSSSNNLQHRKNQTQRPS